ncbi:aldehyde dehydrogenase family protein [Mesorhizobium sp. WSM3873]|nr:aldehyde dehydrogenase family protein [Mesorhizobium sp. WSM3873]OBQ83725.1 hypothetical protein A9K71_23150 [Mesorhizobium sp. WSM3873]
MLVADRRCWHDHPWNFLVFNGRAQDLAGAGIGLRVIVKPAEQTRLVAGAMVAFAAEAGFPEGIVNLICACIGDAVSCRFQ